MATNMYLDLMDDDEPKKASVHHAKTAKPASNPFDSSPDLSAPRIAPDWATVNGNEPVPANDNPVLLNPIEKEDSNHNTYLDLMDDEEHKFHPNSGAALGNYLSLYGGDEVANAGTRAEQVWKLPAGSIAQANAALKESKAAMTSGGKWLKNWANINRPEFVGGVPEASQTFESIKPQGKITSKNYSRFGTKPLHISGQIAQNELAELAAAQAAKQAQTLEHASKAAKILSGFGKTAGVAGVGLGAYDAYKRMHEGDTYGAALGGLGTAASIAPMFMGSAGILPAVGAAAPLMMMAHDRIEHLKQHPEDVQLQNDRFDPLGMPIR